MGRREREERLLPAHPYRDTAIVYGVMAVILVVLAGITGGSLVRAIGAGTIFWLIATAWSWWRFRGRIRKRDAAGVAAAPGVDPAATAGATNGTVNSAVGGNGRGTASQTGNVEQ